MDKIARKVARHIDIPGKHPLEKNAMNILEGSVRNVTKTGGKKTQRLKTIAFDFRLCNPKYGTA